MAGDIVLKIDADTQAYLGKLVQIAQKHKELVSTTDAHGASMSKLGDTASGVARQLVGMVVPLSAIGASASLASGIFEKWRENLEKTKEAMKGVGDLYGAILRYGGGTDTKAIAAAAQGGNRFLSGDALASGVGAYRSPGAMYGASAAQTKEAVAQANLAHAAGQDSTEYLRVYGRLQQAGVKDKLPDIASSFLEHVGDDEKALSLISQNPQQAEGITRLYAALGKRVGGKQGSKLARETVEQYSNFGRGEDIGEFYKTHAAMLTDWKNPGLYAAGSRALDQEGGIEEGSLFANARQGGNLRGVGLAIEALHTDAEKTRAAKYGKASKARDVREAVADAAAAHHGSAAGWMTSAGAQLANAFSSAENDYQQTSSAAALTADVLNSMHETLKDTRDAAVRKGLNPAPPHGEQKP